MIKVHKNWYIKIIWKALLPGKQEVLELASGSLPWKEQRSYEKERHFITNIQYSVPVWNWYVFKTGI